MTTITGKVSVWLSQYSGVTPDEIQKGTVNPHRFVFTDLEDDWSKNGYTRVGVAEITVDAFDGKTIIANKVEALKEEAKGIRAEAHQKCVRIEEQIQNLLAITYKPSEQQ
jgi:hypothetical protein